MDWQQKLEALNALAPCTLHMRKAGDWYVAQSSVEIRDGGILSGAYGSGTIPELAISDHWKKRALLDGEKYLVVGAMRDTRRAVRWNGFMWADVVERGQ